MDPTATRGEWDILSAVEEHGGGHHAELASKAGPSSSTAYRALEQFDAVLDVDKSRISLSVITGYPSPLEPTSVYNTFTTSSPENVRRPILQSKTSRGY